MNDREPKQDKKREDGATRPPPQPSQPERPYPAAGPHAKPELTNPEATPGAGVLPDPGDPDATDSASS